MADSAVKSSQWLSHRANVRPSTPLQSFLWAAASSLAAKRYT